MTNTALTIERLGKGFQSWLASAVPEFTVVDTREFCAAFFAACRSNNRLRSVRDLYPQTVYRIITEQLLLPSTRQNRPHLALIGREFAIFCAEQCPENWRELDAVLNALARFSARDRATWVALAHGHAPSSAGVTAMRDKPARPAVIRNRLRKVSWNVGEVAREIESLLGIPGPGEEREKPESLGPSVALLDLPLISALLRLLAWVEAGVRQVDESGHLSGWDIPSAAAVVRLGDPDRARRARSMRQAPWLGLLWQTLLEAGAIVDERGRAACSALARREGLYDLAQEYVRAEAAGAGWKSLAAERYVPGLNAVGILASRVILSVPETEEDALTREVLDTVTRNVIGSLVLAEKLNVPDPQWKDRIRELMLKSKDPLTEVKIDFQVESLFIRLRSWLAGLVELGLLTTDGSIIEVVPAARFLFLDALTASLEEEYPEDLPE